MAAPSKKCIGCETVKDTSEYYSYISSGTKRYRKICKKCKIAADHKTRQGRIASNREKYKDNRIQQKYGIDLEEYEYLFETQGYTCAICNTVTYRGRDEYLCVDHCHTTGKVRGLLCDLCNRGLGYFKDDVKRLQQAINYLGEIRL